MLEFFLMNCRTGGPTTLLKKTRIQLLSSEFCDIFKNNYF